MAESGTPTPDSIALGEQLRVIRTQRGLSLEQVSEALAQLGHAMAPTVLSRTERGRRDLRAVEVSALARAYGVSPNEILSAFDPDWERARSEERMQQAWRGVHGAIVTFVGALAERWRADPETLTTPRPGIPPVVGIDDADQFAAMRGILEQLGISGAVTLVLSEETGDENDDDEDPDEEDVTDA